MALVIRYFSTTSAGAGDGTTWADRAALFSAGLWSTVITGFAFNGSDGMEARIGPGTHSCSNQLAFTVSPPTAANPFTAVACDTSGNRLAVPDPDWVSSQPVWDTSNMPVIATTANITTANISHCNWRLIRFTASGRANQTLAGNVIDWCIVENSMNNASAHGISGSNQISNCVVIMSGASFLHGISIYGTCTNTRVDGANGNGKGFIMGGLSIAPVKCTAVRCNTGGFVYDGTNVNAIYRLFQCLAAGNAGYGAAGFVTASQVNQSYFERSVFTDNGTYGVDAMSSRVHVVQCRLDRNTTANLSSLGNFPSDFSNDTTSTTAAADYVNSAGGDYRIKYGSPFWGKGFGPGDGPATITG